MNTEEFATKSLTQKLRAASANEALWELESDAIESAADLLESLRAERAELMDLCTRYANQATTAETERDEARQIFAEAPHGPNCSSRIAVPEPPGYGCDCWKAGL